MHAQTIKKAREIWSYLSAENTSERCDAVVVCCSYDLRVCDHACSMIKAGLSDTMIISGCRGNWTKHLWHQPEAEIFFERALKNGMSEDRIFLEKSATNFGENIQFSRRFIPDAKIVTFVSKPNSLLRVKLTAQARWPEIRSLVSAPAIEFPGEVSNIIGVWGAIHEMVGDIERIQKYPELGYQVEHELPDHIVENWQYLIDSGFTAHMMDQAKEM